MKWTVLMFGLLGGAAGAAPLNCDALAEEELLADICQCAQEVESDLARLQCFDEAAKVFRLQQAINDALAEQLARRQGGLDAMRRRLDAAEEE